MTYGALRSAYAIAVLKEAFSGTVTDHLRTGPPNLDPMPPKTEALPPKTEALKSKLDRWLARAEKQVCARGAVRYWPRVPALLYWPSIWCYAMCSTGLAYGARY
eukprot:2475223-Rhodomonas_salina.3